MAKLKDRLFVGVGSHLVAIDPATGTEIWRTKLKTASFVTVALAGNHLLGGAGGEVFCLDPSTGKIIWRNRLKGLGIGLVAFSSSTDLAGGAAMAAADAATTAGA